MGQKQTSDIVDDVYQPILDGPSQPILDGPNQTNPGESTTKSTESKKTIFRIDISEMSEQKFRLRIYGSDKTFDITVNLDDCIDILKRYFVPSMQFTHETFKTFIGCLLKRDLYQLTINLSQKEYQNISYQELLYQLGTVQNLTMRFSQVREDMQLSHTWPKNILNHQVLFD